MKRSFLSLLALAVLIPTFASAANNVMVFPFTAVGPTGPNDWIGTGIQQSLKTEIFRAGATEVLANPNTHPSDPVEDAKSSGANVAVVGNFQIVDQTIRVTGSIIDPQQGRTLGVLSATGPVSDLFKIEDSLADQFHQAIAPAPKTRQLLPDPQPRADVQPQQPVYQQSATYDDSAYVAPSVSYLAPYSYYPSYSYAYVGTPYYYASYPSYCRPFASYCAPINRFGFYGGRFGGISTTFAFRGGGFRTGISIGHGGFGGHIGFAGGGHFAGGHR